MFLRFWKGFGAPENEIVDFFEKMEGYGKA